MNKQELTSTVQVNLYDIAGFPSTNTTLTENIQEWIKPDENQPQVTKYI